MSRKKILDEIDWERKYQEDRWGNRSDDTLNLANDWVSFISHYSTKWLKGEFAPYSSDTVDQFRKSMIKTAAIAVAAVESIDRQRSSINKSTFYERK